MMKFTMYFLIAAFFNFSIGSIVFADSKVAETPHSRFILNDGEAFDQSTKLIWSRCSVGTTWQKGVGCVGSPVLMRIEEAEQFTRSLGGSWRVPTIEELCSIVERTRTSPALNPEVFPDIKDVDGEAPYLSVSKVKEMPSLVYYVDFANGGIDGHSKGFPMYVRLVRNKQ